MDSVSERTMLELHQNRSLRAMISQFVFFIGIAATCFSGLLYTLWTLGKSNILLLCKLLTSKSQSRRRSNRQNPMDLQVNCLVNGADLVWQHLPQLRTGIKFPYVVRPNSYDYLRRLVQYSPVDE